MSVIDQALQFLKNSVPTDQDITNYFKQPNPNPSLASPIPPSQQVTQQSYPGVQSPIPQSQVVPHQAGDSGANTDANNVVQALAQLKQNLIGNTSQMSQSTAATPIKQAVAKIASPTPTPTIDPVKQFGDFTTTPIPQQYAPTIYSAAQSSGVNQNLLASHLFTEGGFNPKAKNVNDDGSIDRGIAQINNKAHPEVTDQQAYDPNFSINWMANDLSGHLKQFNGDWNKTIAAYRVGPNATPQSFSTYGQEEIDKVAKGLTPQLIKKLGLKTSN